MLKQLFSTLQNPFSKACGLLGPVSLLVIGCATPKSAVDYIDGTEINFAPVMVAAEADPQEKPLNVAIHLFLPGADLDKLEADGTEVINIDDSGIPRIDHKAINPKIRRLETHFFPIALKNVLDKSGQWGQTFVSPGEIQSPDLFIDASIQASDGHSIALYIYAKDSTGRVWFNETVEYLTQEFDYLNAQWPDRDPYDAVFNYVTNKLVEFRDTLSPDELRQIRMVSEMRFASDLAPDAFENYLAQDESKHLYVQRFPAENDPNYQIVQQLRGTELEMLNHIEEYYNDLFQGVYDPYSVWREQFRQLSIEMESYRAQGTNQRTASVLTGLLILAAAATSGAESYEEGDSAGVVRAVAWAANGVALSTAMYGSAMEKIDVAMLKAKEINEISDLSGEGIQPKVIELEGRTYQLTGDVDDRFRQIRGIIRQRYLLETGQEDLIPAESIRSI